MRRNCVKVKIVVLYSWGVFTYYLFIYLLCIVIALIFYIQHTLFIVTFKPLVERWSTVIKLSVKSNETDRLLFSN